MWSRAQLKGKAKNAMNRNFWRTILVTLIVFMIGGATSVNFSYNFDLSEEDIPSFEELFIENFEEAYKDVYEDTYQEDDYYEEGDINSIIEEDLPSGFDSVEEMAVVVFGVVIIVLIVILLIVAVIGILVSTFFYIPLEVGTKRFFFKNLNQSAEIKEVAYAFDNSYKNVVKILFFRNLSLLGWSLLFVIPGIVKSYEYMMVPYLLAENPKLTKEQVFALSKQMMSGHKWNAFVLHLSFIGWDFLSNITLGILGIFYVQPYRCHTFAALYEELSLINGRPAFAYQSDMGYTYEEI